MRNVKTTINNDNLEEALIRDDIYGFHKDNPRSRLRTILFNLMGILTSTLRTQTVTDIKMENHKRMLRYTKRIK